MLHSIRLGAGGFAVIVAAWLLGGCATSRIAIVRDPLSADEHVQLGAVYEQEGRPELAQREYEAALRRDRRHAGAHLGLGNLAVGRRDLGEAERRYRAAIKADPRLADALNNLAWVYLTRGERADEAAALARRAIEAQPGRAHYYGDTLGVALTRAGRAREGIEALERALAAVPPGEARLTAEVLEHLAEARRAAAQEP